MRGNAGIDHGHSDAPALGAQVAGELVCPGSLDAPRIVVSRHLGSRKIGSHQIRVFKLNGSVGLDPLHVRMNLQLSTGAFCCLMRVKLHDAHAIAAPHNRCWAIRREIDFSAIVLHDQALKVELIILGDGHVHAVVVMVLDDFGHRLGKVVEVFVLLLSRGTLARLLLHDCDLYLFRRLGLAFLGSDGDSRIAERLRLYEACL